MTFLFPMFLVHRSLLDCLFHAVNSVVSRMFLKQNQSMNFTPGFIMVLHTFGRDLSHYLNRLLLRGLLVKGDGISGADAIYWLLGTLTITPVGNSFFLRLSTGLRLLWKGDIEKDAFFRLLKRTSCTPMEQTILSMSRKVPLSTAELISCIDQGAKISLEADVMDTLYPSPDMTFETLADSVQLHHTQYPVLQAISNLYLKQQILFQKM